MLNVLKWLAVGYVVVAILAWIAGMAFLVAFGDTDAEHVVRVTWYAIAWPFTWVPSILWSLLQGG